MMSKNKYSQTKTQKINEKKTWEKPELIGIELSKIKQEEMELYYQQLADPEIFRLIDNSGPTRTGRY